METPRWSLRRPSRRSSTRSSMHWARIAPCCCPAQLRSRLPAPGDSAAPGADATVDPDLVPDADPANGAFVVGRERAHEGTAAHDRKTDEARPAAVGMAVAERAGQHQPGGARGQAAAGALLMPRDGRERLPGDRANQPRHADDRRGLASGPLGHSWASPRSTHVALTLSVDPELRQRLILVPSVVACLLIIAMGIIVFTARRE